MGTASASANQMSCILPAHIFPHYFYYRVLKNYALLALNHNGPIVYATTYDNDSKCVKTKPIMDNMSHTGFGSKPFIPKEVHSRLFHKVRLKVHQRQSIHIQHTFQYLMPLHLIHTSPN